jgi:hypothetical protein
VSNAIFIAGFRFLLFLGLSFLWSQALFFLGAGQTLAGPKASREYLLFLPKTKTPASTLAPFWEKQDSQYKGMCTVLQSIHTQWSRAKPWIPFSKSG